MAANVVKIRYFAAVREAIGREEETLSPPPGTTVAGILDDLATRWPALRGMRPYLRVAVNLEVAPNDRVLADGDDLAVLPPLAGGADAGLVGFSAEPLCTDRVIDSVRGPGVGGLVVFLGLVREHNEGHAVEKLEYEAYLEMAEKELLAVVASVERDHPGARLAAVHRTGVLGVGDLAVVVAAGAAHRDDAFAAARALIDRIKEKVPIWKREVGPDGVHWVGLPKP